MAEIIVGELEKFTKSHELIIQSTEKILGRYNDIGILIERMDKRDQIIAQCIKNMQLLTDQYLLTISSPSVHIGTIFFLILGIERH